ncbi:hypothetical protein OAT67_00230 [Bacteriovoracaceae bacterium]|nr:hypothetical protein [Bacteriovoracaceae bacterium]
MYIKLFCTVFLIFFALRSHAATFIPVKVTDQVRDSDLVISGVPIGKTFKKIPTGEVVTEYTFKLNEIVGIEHSKIVNRNNFKVLVPGGKWQGVSYKVSGVPTFKEGTNSIVLLRKGKFGYYLTNLAMSSFSKSTTKNDDRIFSEVFRTQKDVGNIKIKRFNEILISKWGSPLQKIEEDKFVKVPHVKKSKGYNKDSRKRTPASFEHIEEKEKKSSFWLLFFIAFSGIVAGFLRRSKS